MRRYDELIEVRRGLVAGQEAPEQFIWRDRLWVVRDVVSHWVETGAWWDQAGIAALLGVGVEGPEGSGGVTAVPLGADLLAESERWRVEAYRGRVFRAGYGVFDLAFDWVDARWRLVGCAD